MKHLFNLDPDIHFLNHGSFGACPKPVFDAYQAWQRELERQPVAFLGRRITGLLAESRGALGAFLHVAPDDLVYFPNPTTALNMVARSFVSGRADDGQAPYLRAGDEILTTDHEYGALDRTWDYVCKLSGARYIQHPVPLPLPEPDAFVEHFWAGVTPATRIIFISHITSPTALIFPAAEICCRARDAGILTVVDGAHAPGQIDLDLASVGADIYAGACHKWLCAPKGAAFLYARKEVQKLLTPLVVSWGWEAEAQGASQFVDWHEWQGTRDLSAYLTVPAAIRFQQEHDWGRMRTACHALAAETRDRILALTGLPPICGNDAFGQMFSALLPPCDAEALKARLWDERRVEIPVMRRGGDVLARVSFQAYNDRADADALLAGLEALLPQVARAHA
jgi:isopenicillin-N epimerase